MGIVERFQEYADAFEESLADDDWSRLEQYFTEDTVYDTGQGPDAIVRGRGVLLAWFKKAVDDFDRRFDTREVTFSDGPREENGAVSFRWDVRYTKSGLPDLRMTGIEIAEFDADSIALLRDVYDVGVLETLGAWMDTHGSSLASET